MQRTRSTFSSPTRCHWSFLTFLQLYRLSLHVPITHACPTLPFDGLQSAFGGVFDSNSVLFALSSSDLFKWTAGSCLAVSS
jgi:hypothetical protein